MVFIDPEKTYDKVPRYLTWWVLNKMSVPRDYINIIKDMYEEEVLSVRTTSSTEKWAKVTIGLYHGFTGQLQADISLDWLCMLVDESIDGVKVKLGRW